MTFHLIFSYCALYKLATIFTVYSTVSNKKSPHKTAIDALNIYQVMLKVTRKKPVLIINANV